METYYILIVVVLFALAISDLVVGVSNDAVNFLNSAIGSRAASFRTILVVAALGVLIGAIFSNGMMEVARKGVFNPDQFAFSDIMIIFLAVMFTDILLLDFFNTVGLPTSTTVSIVFELLGSAVAVSIFKVAGMDGANGTLGDYINTERALIIIAGIFLSVVIAFTIGMIVQWVVRLAFSFNLKKTYRFWSGLWGGFATTAILYFLVIKGAKGSTLVTDEALEFIRAHTTTMLLASFVGLSVIFQLLTTFTRVNILKITVLLGTFALAMAFAGNDLVNFIGVPLAGFESFRDFIASGGAEPGSFMMDSLIEPVSTPVYFLIGAGIIMVLTLRFSKKAKSVTATTIDLSRQGEGTERFASSSLARFIVRRSVEASNGVNRVTPSPVSRFVASRFREVPSEDSRKGKMAFDLVRASVNLVVASILIAFGTSLKLPLSTTYVTFMVAMGTSLADGAWGRESAVYRITGVLTVVGGWFFTAFTAFCASFLIGSLIFIGKLPVVLALVAISVFIIFRTHALHKRRTEKAEKAEKEVFTASNDILRAFDEQVKKSVLRMSKLLYLTYVSLFKEKRKELKKVKKESRKLAESVKELKQDIPAKLRKFEETEIESGQYYVQAVNYLREASNSLIHIVMPAFHHVDNNHPLDKEQSDSFREFNNKTSEFFNLAVNLLQKKNFDDLDDLTQQRDELMEMINEIIKNRIKILKKAKKGVKISMTYIEMLTESKNLLLHLVQLVKAHMNLIQSMEKKKKMPSIEEVTIP